MIHFSKRKQYLSTDFVRNVKVCSRSMRYNSDGVAGISASDADAL